ncbi:MAG: anti-sigma regulatory factor [Polyangiales bacterium]
MAEVVAHWELPIASEDDIIVVRRKARALAQEKGFDGFAAAALTTAASELARNAWVHGHGGTATIEVLTDGYRTGIRLTFVDSGPGIADLDRVLAGGYSTARSLGLGLSGSKRLVEDFEIQSAPGEGTKVVIAKWTRF